MANGFPLGNLPTAGGKMSIAHQVTVHALGIHIKIEEASEDFFHHHVHISLSENLCKLTQ